MENWRLYRNLKRVDLYVSNLGKVKSIRKDTKKERMLSFYNRGGKREQYLAFGYREENGNKKLISVHRAVAETFIGPSPSNNHDVDHIDNNPLNNRVDNLQWLTKEDNGYKAHR